MDEEAGDVWVELQLIKKYFNDAGNHRFSKEIS